MRHAEPNVPGSHSPHRMSWPPPSLAPMSEAAIGMSGKSVKPYLSGKVLLVIPGHGGGSLPPTGDSQVETDAFLSPEPPSALSMSFLVPGNGATAFTRFAARRYRETPPIPPLAGSEQNARRGTTGSGRRPPKPWLADRVFRQVSAAAASRGAVSGPTEFGALVVKVDGVTREGSRKFGAGP